MKRILIVEDDVEFRDVLAECLVDAGYEVETTDNGLTARRLLELYGFDLVLSDWRMPGFGGLDLLCYVKQHLRTPFILMTGFGDFLAPSDVYESGAVSFLPKPFDRRDLILELETVLAANNPEISIDPLYQQVDSQVIRACERLPVDLFLKIAAGKYMKVAHRGSPLTLERLQAHLDRGLNEIFVRKRDLHLLGNAAGASEQDLSGLGAKAA